MVEETRLEVHSRSQIGIRIILVCIAFDYKVYLIAQSSTYHKVGRRSIICSEIIRLFPRFHTSMSRSSPNQSVKVIIPLRLILFRPGTTDLSHTDIFTFSPLMQLCHFTHTDPLQHLVPRPGLTHRPGDFGS